MTRELLRLGAADRVLVLAPHPDDESIACGGLLLAARDAGAARRVVTLTDGDNNPWPQRWLEKRWRIDAAARVRWGSRRRAESQVALGQLGIGADERIYFGLPDSGLTTLLMHAAEKLVVPLREQIAAFRPTHLALPALTDRHPDHSATHIAARLALLAAGASPQPLAYRVHGNQTGARYAIELDADQRGAKRDAIAAHRTQVTLSGKRFLAFAAPTEPYGEVLIRPRSDHPLEAAVGPGFVLHLRVYKRALRGDLQVQALLVEANGEIRTLQFPLDTNGKPFAVRDTRGDRTLGTASWRNEKDAWRLTLPLPEPASARLGFAKLARRRSSLVVFDRYGWQTVSFEKSS